MIGKVVEIVRYPVKSMAGERLPVAEIDWQGMEGDRQYAFVRDGDPTRFPWFTARDLSDLVRYRPLYDEPGRPRTSPLTVRTPDGRVLLLRDPALHEALEAESGLRLTLLQLGAGAYDAMPISLVTTAALTRLDQRHGAPLDRRRFRANIVVQSDEGEIAWKGRRLRLGAGEDAAELLLAYPAPRCAMVTIDPDDARRDPTVLRTIARDFGAAFTVYASVARPGWVREGDAVSLTPD